MIELPAADVAQLLANALEAKAIPYAIGGALAYGVWGDPRATYDVDINVFVRPEELDTALDVLIAAGVAIDKEVARQADRDGDVLVGRYRGMRVDLFTPTIPFAWEAMTTSKRVTGPTGAAQYLSAEATAVFKLLFFRGKDLLDVEKLIATQQEKLDVAYVRRWLVDMMGEGDERVVALDQMLARRPKT